MAATICRLRGGGREDGRLDVLVWEDDAADVPAEEGGGVRAREDEHITTSGQGQREAGQDGGVHRRVLPPNIVARPLFGRDPRSCCQRSLAASSPIKSAPTVSAWKALDGFFI